MYVKTYITLQDVDGNEDDYEVGADVSFDPGGNGWASSYEVGEPDISAPDGKLATSRLAKDPQAGGVFVGGWADALTEALVEAFQDKVEDMYEDSRPDPDEYEDPFADREPTFSEEDY